MPLTDYVVKPYLNACVMFLTAKLIKCAAVSYMSALSKQSVKKSFSLPSLFYFKTMKAMNELSAD